MDDRSDGSLQLTRMLPRMGARLRFRVCRMPASPYPFTLLRTLDRGVATLTTRRIEFPLSRRKWSPPTPAASRVLLYTAMLSAGAEEDRNLVGILRSYATNPDTFGIARHPGDIVSGIPRSSGNKGRSRHNFARSALFPER